MAAFNFPNSPSNGDTYSANGVTFVYDSTNGAWKKNPAFATKGDKGDSGTSISVNNNADNRIITGSDTAGELNGESNLTFDGSNLAFDTAGTLKIKQSDETSFNWSKGIQVGYDAGNIPILIFAYDGNGYISDRGGELRITSDSTPIRIRTLNYGGNPDSGTDIAVFTPSGSVDLYYSGNKKFETLSGGAKVTGDLEVTGTITGSVAAVPVGTIVMYGGVTAPSGWQLCDGSTPQTTALQTILGGSGQTVPDLRDKFIVGAGSSYNLKATGGSADAVVVEHKHTTSFDGKKYFPGGNSTTVSYGGAGSYPADVFSMDNEGVSGTGKNLPPYYALTYIIKY